MTFWAATSQRINCAYTRTWSISRSGHRAAAWNSEYPQQLLYLQIWKYDSSTGVETEECRMSTPEIRRWADCSGCMLSALTRLAQVHLWWRHGALVYWPQECATVYSNISVATDAVICLPGIYRWDRPSFFFTTRRRQCRWKSTWRSVSPPLNSSQFDVSVAPLPRSKSEFCSALSKLVDASPPSGILGWRWDM